MGSPDLRLKPGLRVSHRLSPKAFFRLNLLTVPAAELFDMCSEAVSGNIFISFSPPKSICASLDDADGGYENIAADQTLDSALELQIAECPGLSQMRGAARDPFFWSSLLNDRGYMNCSDEAAAAAAGTSLRQTAEFLDALRAAAEPAGLFARDLRGSLLIQLERRGLMESDPYLLLKDEAAANDPGWPQNTVKSLGWTKMRTDAALAVLRTLDPAPGRNFRPARFCLPDIEFIPSPDDIAIRLLLENMPSVSADLAYLRGGENGPSRASWSAGEWRCAKETLIRLGLRYRTLLRIAASIKEVQGAMIRDMTRSPAPFVYEDAAGAVGLHPSTSSAPFRIHSAGSAGRIFRCGYFSPAPHARGRI